MTLLVPLRSATDRRIYGGKAAQLAAALHGGLPVPDGVALSPEGVEAVRDRDAATLDALASLLGDTAVAVRSSALDEDGADASFAGAHQSLLGVRGLAAVLEAVVHAHSSGTEAGALAYRQKLGLAAQCRMGIVVQHMVPSDVAGVMFTRNPLNGADERVVEASWGLGEAVVSSLVTPDYYRVARGGRVLHRMLGEKDATIVMHPGGGTVEVAEPSHRVDNHCLTDSHLLALDALATQCDDVFGNTGHDVEFAFVGTSLFLLQRRPITRA